MIALYQLDGAWGLSSVSPFCIKVETFLRMAEVPFEPRFGDPRKAPKGKVPWIDDDGTIVADSQRILEHVTARHGVKLDAKLDEGQRARGHALRRMLEEGTYFGLVYRNWADETGWASYKPVFLPYLPPVIGGPIIELVRRRLKKALWEQGTARHDAETVYAMLQADYDALATQLGESDYLFGPEPTSFDATAYAFVAVGLAFPAATPLKAFLESKPNLVAYRARVERRFFGR